MRRARKVEPLARTPISSRLADSADDMVTQNICSIARELPVYPE